MTTFIKFINICKFKLIVISTKENTKYLDVIITRMKLPPKSIKLSNDFKHADKVKKKVSKNIIEE